MRSYHRTGGEIGEPFGLILRGMTVLRLMSEPNSCVFWTQQSPEITHFTAYSIVTPSRSHTDVSQTLKRKFRHTITRFSHGGEETHPRTQSTSPRAMATARPAGATTTTATSLGSPPETASGSSSTTAPSSSPAFSPAPAAASSSSTKHTQLQLSTRTCFLSHESRLCPF